MLELRKKFIEEFTNYIHKENIENTVPHPHSSLRLHSPDFNLLIYLDYEKQKENLEKKG